MTTQPTAPDPGVVLDVPAITALATGNSQMRALAYLAAIRGELLLIPAIALTAAAANLEPAHVDELRWAIAAKHVRVTPLTSATTFHAAAEAAAHHTGAITAGHIGAVARACGLAIVTTADQLPQWHHAGHRAHALADLQS